MMRKFIVLACLVTLIATAAEPVTRHVFEIRPVADAPSSETERMAYGPAQGIELYVVRSVLVDDSALKSVKASADKQGYARIDLTFTTEGTKRFAAVTHQNLGKRIALLIDGRVYSAPKIASAITKGKVQITGFKSLDEAKELAGRIDESISTKK